MKIDDKYAPQQIEPKWYDYWMRHDMFHSEPDEREPYTVVIPPPNVTGMLHMGHMLNETIQDVLVRRARMQGKNACWVPGTDRHGGQGRPKAQGRGHRQELAHARRVPPPCVGVEGKARRHHPEPVA